MQQLEITYFWPLTEQLPLDLDFTRSREYAEGQRKKLLEQTVASGMLIAGGGVTAATLAPTMTLAFRPEPDAVGYWQISQEMQIWRKQKPNWLHIKMAKVFFGFIWNDR